MDAMLTWTSQGFQWELGGNDKEVSTRLEKQERSKLFLTTLAETRAQRFHESCTWHHGI